MRVQIDSDICTSCGLCCDTCPEVFEMGDMSAVVKVDVVTKGSEETCREAVENCPVECISIVEE